MKLTCATAARWWLALAVLVLMSPTTALAQGASDKPSTLATVLSEKILRVGVNPDFKPFSFEEQGARVGVDIEIAGLLAQKLGVSPKIIVPKSFSDLIPMLESNEIDIIIAGMSITFDRARIIDFSSPYFETGLSILLNKVKAARLGLGSVATYAALTSALDKNGKANQLSIAVTEGKAPQRAVPRFFPYATIKAYPTNEAAAAATLKGATDIMVHDEIFLKVWLKENIKQAQFRMVVLDPPFVPDYYGFGVRKGNQDFLNLLDVFILELKANADVAKFLGQYLPITTRVITKSYQISEDYYGGD